MRVMSWATQDWRTAWALSESSCFDQPLHRQACIDDDGSVPVPVHAHPAVSASLISRASRIKSAELPGRGLPLEYLLPELCKQLMVRLVGQ